MKYRAAAGSWSFPAAANSHPLIFFTKMDIPTVPGSLYTVATKTTCDITDTATGTPIDTVSAGSLTFQAQGNFTTLSDPAATYSRVNFKNAAAALRLLGGGDQLPSGYLAAEFLESTGTQGFTLDFPYNQSSEVFAVAEYTKVTTNTPGLFSNGGLVNFADNKNFSILITQSYSLRADHGAEAIDVYNLSLLGSKIEYRYNDEGVFLNGKKIITFSPVTFSGREFRVLARNAAYLHARLFSFSLATEAEKNMLIPAVDKAGVPCLVDKKTKQSFYNSGSGAFIVGMTLAQASKLGKLPVGGGTLKISLPENYTDDEAVVAALSTATENGWIFEIQTYTTDGASASTFALRRIWVKKTADPAGVYVDATCERWHVEWCQTVLGAEPSDLGYEPSRSVDVALAEWELTPYVYPEEENLSI